MKLKIEQNELKKKVSINVTYCLQKCFPGPNKHVQFINWWNLIQGYRIFFIVTIIIILLTATVHAGWTAHSLFYYIQYNTIKRNESQVPGCTFILLCWECVVGCLQFGHNRVFLNFSCSRFSLDSRSFSYRSTVKHSMMDKNQPVQCSTIFIFNFLWHLICIILSFPFFIKTTV